MSNRVDKLFKDKLESHTLPPSAQAWEKVEAHLEKKNKMGLTLRIAAGVALLGLLTFVGLNWNDGTGQVKEVAKTEKPEPVIKEKRAPVVEEKKENKKAPRTKRVAPATPAIEQPKEQSVEQLAIVPEPVVIEIEDAEPRTPNPEPRTQKGITLTYSLPSIKKEEPVVAQEEPKKTGLERVLEIAREVKNGDSPLGELREAKNDILALEFRKDKNKKH